MNNLKVRKTIPFTIALKVIIYKKVNKEMGNVYAENYKTLLKGIKGDLNKWKNILYSRIRRRLNVVEMAVLLK